ncbi:hypothetical protein [Novosphingobium rosa]|uniref:hypothetical protein n=1 Tax=Novosphingobium rosa TaxID=76978 RepID=UPI00082A6B56|nr:hypothetical protein [Novosphingobium rosa]
MMSDHASQVTHQPPQAQPLSLFWRWYGRLVDLLSLTGLTAMIGTTLYCLEIRSHYERSYIAGFLIALLGLIVMLIAWAQQVIAARDLASWRDMIEWQIRAAHRKIALRGEDAELHDQYFERLIDTLIVDMRATAYDASAQDAPAQSAADVESR